MAETSTIFGFMKYVSATDILSDFKKTVDSYFVNSLKRIIYYPFLICFENFLRILFRKILVLVAYIDMEYNHNVRICFK